MLVLRGLTFELSRALRQAPLGRGRTMYNVPWSGQAAPAVAGRLQRRVRRHFGVAGYTAFVRTHCSHCFAVTGESATMTTLSGRTFRSFGGAVQ